MVQFSKHDRVSQARAGTQYIILGSLRPDKIATIHCRHVVHVDGSAEPVCSIAPRLAPDCIHHCGFRLVSLWVLPLNRPGTHGVFC
jgi:hypothetical protein